MQALRHEILPPSGAEFAACLRLTPATVTDSGPSTSQTTGNALFNVVVARSNFLRIFEVREEAPPISTQKDEERERRASVRKGTEAVEGEVEMDASGEGFVNMGSVKVNCARTFVTAGRATVSSLYVHQMNSVYLPSYCEGVIFARTSADYLCHLSLLARMV